MKLYRSLNSIAARLALALCLAIAGLTALQLTPPAHAAVLGFADRISVLTSTTGTGTVTLGSAATQYQAGQAALDGKAVEYTILDVNGVGWETGVGTYTHSGTTLTRGPVASSNSGSAINISGSGSRVFLGLLAQSAESVYNASRSYISGAELTLPSTTTVSMSATTMFVESLNRVVYCPAPTAITPTLVASAVRYIYASWSAGTCTLTDSATAPVAFAQPAGTARSMSGDASKRFVGPIYSNSGASAILPMAHLDLGNGLSEMRYTARTTSAPYRVVTGYTGTSFASQNLSTIVPPGIATEMFSVAAGSTSGSGALQINTSLDGTNFLSISLLTTAGSTVAASGWTPILPATPALYVSVGALGSATTPTISIDVSAYRFRR